jgi:hypothetical protein
MAYINTSFQGSTSLLPHLSFVQPDIVSHNAPPIRLIRTMNQQSPKEKAEALIGALEKYGQGDYIGESISQLEHCLQAAHQASKASAY